MKFFEIILIILITLFVLIILSGLGIGEYFYNLILNRRSNKSSFLNASHNQSKLDYSKLPKDNYKKALEWFEETAKEKTLYSFDNLKLNYYVIKNRVPTNKWIILCHGYNGNAKRHAQNAINFYNMGFNLLIPDARGHGKSEGDYIGMGWKDRLDIVSYIKDIVKKYEQPEIILYGCSMGASTIMMAAGENLPTNVKAIIADCGYSSLWKELSYQLKKIMGLPPIPIINFMSLITKFRAGYWLGNANALTQLKKSKTPILFIHGDSDTFVPTSMVYENYNAATCPKQKLIVKGAGHVESDTVNPDLYWHTIYNFISKYINLN